MSMTGTEFDHFVRGLSSAMSRRGVLAAIGPMFAVPPLGQGQVRRPSCGAEGEVCTPLVGCCAGLLCATSMINVNYGVCIPGEGEIAPVTRALVIPGDQQMVNALLEEELARQDEAVLAADLLDERDALLQEQRDRQRAKKQTQRDRRRAHQER